MASGRIGSASGLNVFIDWSSTENSITANLYLYNQYRINTSVSKNWSLSINGNTNQGTVTLGEKAAGTTTLIGSHTVTGLSANTNYSISGTLNINLNNYNGSAVSSLSTSGTANTDALQYSEINSFSVQSMGLTTAVIEYSVSRTANIYCSVDGMAWGDPRVWNTTSGTFTISGLSPNTQHSFVILVRAVDTGLDRISGTIYGMTLNMGTIASAPNINFGDTATIVKSNPSGARNDLRIETLSPSTVTIATRTQIPNNYTLTLTDDEWDTLYKKLGNSNSITIRYVIDTIEGGDTYYHWVDRTLTLKGNQKTIRTNVSNSWKRGKLWTNVNGTWKRGVLWTNVSGTWKRGI